MNNLIKVVFEVKDEETGEIIIETPWAIHKEYDVYILDDHPFFAYGISYKDEFEAIKKYPDDERPYFTKVLKKNGHSTIRLFFKNCTKEDYIDIFDKKLKALSCTNEFYNSKLVCIDIADSTKINSVIQILYDGFEKELWEYEYADVDASLVD